jgi:hypothetical protein
VQDNLDKHAYIKLAAGLHLQTATSLDVDGDDLNTAGQPGPPKLRGLLHVASLQFIGTG